MICWTRRLCLLAVALLSLFGGSQSFMPPPVAARTKQRALVVRREVVPAIFAAACAGALIGYVVTHYDEIVAKQRVAVERTMTKQVRKPGLPWLLVP
jgi:hypothetical protein